MPPVQMLQQQPGVRRASDPVRTLDRTFGVDGQLSRHQRSGSYNQLNGGPVQTRVPMHGARIRGMSGDTFFHQQQMPPMYNQQQQPPRMAGNGVFQNQATSVNAQFPASYNNQVSNYPGAAAAPVVATAAGPTTWNNGYSNSGQQTPNFGQAQQPHPGSGFGQQTNNSDFNNWQQNNGNNWNAAAAAA